MPIANCFIKESEVALDGLDLLVTEWASKIGTDVNDITMTFVPVLKQAGQTYSVLINLYLPDFWSGDDVKGIQISLLDSVCKCLNVKADRIFILTMLISTGNVVENGKIVSW